MKIQSASKWRPSNESERPEKLVTDIITQVRRRGATALREYAKRWDGGVPKSFVIQLKEAEAAWTSMTLTDRKALRTACSQLQAWSRSCLPVKPKKLKKNGMTLEQRIDPVASAAIYVPGGRYPLVSSVLMGLIPAAIARVERRVLMTPARNGVIHSAVLAAAHLGGATEIWAVGGAQAIAAAAYGAGPLVPVDLVVGPGNSFVTEAKRQVQGRLAIDMLAGPSELLVIIDSKTPLEPIALDLLAQAEHGEDSRSIVLSKSQPSLVRLSQKLDQLAGDLYDNAMARQVRSQVRGYVVRTDGDLVELADRIASEHLHIATSQPNHLARKITNFGSLFMGISTPVALGDYVSGGNHVLPTGRTGRFRGGLSVDDFLVRRTVQTYKPGKEAKLYCEGATLAALEGLVAHEASLTSRR